jgi:hypothetical protein
MKTANRIAKYYDHNEPEPPEDPKEREEYWNETFFKALANARRMMRSKDDAISLAATQEVLQMARTRMRHGKRIDGTGNGTMTHEEVGDMIDEMNGRKPSRKEGEEDASMASSLESGLQPVDDSSMAEEERAEARTPTKPEDAEQAAFNAHVDAIQKLAPQMAKKIGLTKVTMPRFALVEFVKSLMKHEGKPASEISADLMRHELWYSLKEMKAEQEEAMKSSAVPA